MIEKPKAVYIELTIDQLAQARPFLDYAKQEGAAGRPGIVVAQIGYDFPSEMRVGYWDHDQATGVTKSFAVPTRLDDGK